MNTLPQNTATIHPILDVEEIMAAAFDALRADLREADHDDGPDPCDFLLDDEALPPDWPGPPARAPEPALPFAEWVECQASFFRSLGTAAGDWLAGRIAADAATVRLVRAGCPAEFDERESELNESHHARLRAEGYDSACDEFGPVRS